MRSSICVAVIGILLLGFVSVQAQTNPKIGIRGGIGTDVTLGIAYGGGANYLLTFPKKPNNSLELGLILFGGSFEETTEEFHTYEETTDVMVIGALANYLIGYKPGQAGSFFVAGIGLASVNVEWEESSETDGSLGTPVGSEGSKQSAEGSAAGVVFNLGGGLAFNSGLDIRLEVPVILSFSAPGEASSVIPTAIATVGFRF